MGLADAFPEAAGPGTALPEAMLGMAGASPVGRCSDNTHPRPSMQRGPPVTPLQVMGRGALLRGTEFKRRRVGVLRPGHTRFKSGSLNLQAMPSALREVVRWVGDLAEGTAEGGRTG